MKNQGIDDMLVDPTVILLGNFISITPVIGCFGYHTRKK
jgi:hypothetical protein